MSETARKGRTIRLECVDSTNTYLKKLSLDGKASFYDCVIADTQTSGRGRLGRSFASTAGKGIYLSYLLNPKNATPSEIAKITAWGAVAVRDALYSFCGIDTGIKWVNDLVFGGRKVCGILTEMTFGLENGKIHSVIMGIGINVNHDETDFPEELRSVATSAKIINGEKTDIDGLCEKLLLNLDKLNDDFPKNKEYYLSEYRKSCVVTGKRIRIIKGDAERCGTALDIDDNFGLVVAFDDGKTETVTDGDVSVRGFYGYI